MCTAQVFKLELAFVFDMSYGFGVLFLKLFCIFFYFGAYSWVVYIARLGCIHRQVVQTAGDDASPKVPRYTSMEVLRNGHKKC